MSLRLVLLISQHMMLYILSTSKIWGLFGLRPLNNQGNLQPILFLFALLEMCQTLNQICQCLAKGESHNVLSYYNAK